MYCFSSDNLTLKMANLSNKDPRFVNVSDKTSRIQLGKMSESIYANEWFKAYEALTSTKASELKILKILSEVIHVSNG